MSTKKYLFISECGEVSLNAKVFAEDLALCDYGIISVIDITSPDDIREYYRGVWTKIEVDEEI